MITPASLTRYEDSQLLELGTWTLAELTRRTRPTPENRHLRAALRHAQDAQEQLEILHHHARRTEGPRHVVDTSEMHQGAPA